MVFAQLLVSHPKGLLQHAISEMLLQLCFKVLIYYHPHPLISFSFSSIIASCSSFSNWDLSFFCGKQFLLPYQISDRTASPALLRSYSALVSATFTVKCYRIQFPPLCLFISKTLKMLLHIGVCRAVF